LFYVAITRARQAVYIGTGATRGDSQRQIPSRFIDEIQYEPTVNVMKELQKMASEKTAIKKTEAKLNLISKVNRFSGIKSLTQTLLSHYLVELGDQSLIEKIASILSSSKETPFVYRFLKEFTRENNNIKSQSNLHAAWNEIDE
jgi:predicted transcriptional regulator